MKLRGCPLCEGAGGALIFDSPPLRVIRALEPGFPAFYRLVWSRHVAEFSDLAPAQRHLCMDAVAEVEALVRKHLGPAKVNLASLGNVVPHLHWHVIARFEWDSHFPDAVWATARRQAPAHELARLERLLPRLDAEIADTLARPGH